MNYAQNPYAALQAGPPPVQGQGATGASQPWDVGEVISVAWERFKANWPVLVFSYFVWFLVVEIFGFAPTVFGSVGVIKPGSVAFLGVTFVALLVQLSVGAFLHAGVIWLDLARGGTPGLEVMFSAASRMLPLLGCTS